MMFMLQIQHCLNLILKGKCVKRQIIKMKTCFHFNYAHDTDFMFENKGLKL